MIYRFVWDGGKGMAWWGMILPRSEGGLGLCDLVLLAWVCAVRRLNQIWSENNSIWVKWARERYVKGRSFGNIEKKQGDLLMYVAISALHPAKY